MIIHVNNTEIAILLLFRARISVNLPLIGPTGKSGLMTVSDSNNHFDILLSVSRSEFKCHFNSQIIHLGDNEKVISTM